MRSLNFLNGVMVSVVLALSAQCASAQDAVQQTAMQSTPGTIAAVQESSLQERLLPLQSAAGHAQAGADSFRVSDMLLAMIAGVVLVGLQLRRQQKAQSETRIINFSERLNNLERVSTMRVTRRATAEATMSQAAEAELIAHAERG